MKKENNVPNILSQEEICAMVNKFVTAIGEQILDADTLSQTTLEYKEVACDEVLSSQSLLKSLTTRKKYLG